MNKSEIAAHELRAALGVMLTAWDNATEKLTAFLEDPSPANAGEYGKHIPKMFEAATLGRTIYHKHKEQK